ncbi:MAG TPA: AbrB/MazE/SpoVT family DNA-binding domain-containing protein [Methylophilaceae bacterium]|nr:AbrB/MazE/SpoVT family DNA-binding domain-containing protein [Methylophilaceae bacterium]
MRTSLRKIGNSRGVLIPAALLAACEIGDSVEMRVENNRIIIEPVAPQHRQGWFDNVKPEKEFDALAGLKETAIEQDEWEW